MCIRDSLPGELFGRAFHLVEIESYIPVSYTHLTVRRVGALQNKAGKDISVLVEKLYNQMMNYRCLLYTSAVAVAPPLVGHEVPQRIEHHVRRIGVEGLRHVLSLIHICARLGEIP